MILKETILSAFTERGTLLKWLKKVEAALNNAVLTDISVEQVSATQVKLKFTFENGDYVESPVLTLPRGEKGEKGEDGKDGLDGEGIAATIEVGTVTTGAAGTNASVTNVGTEQRAILNFVIPRGDTGASGAEGSAGVGFDDADEISINDGNINITAGDNGVNIEASFEVAVGEEILEIPSTMYLPLKGSESIVIDVDESGDFIEVHLDADIAAKLGRVLMTPMSAPASVSLVAVDTSNAQTMLTLGDGLTIEGGALKATGGGGGISARGFEVDIPAGICSSGSVVYSRGSGASFGSEGGHFEDVTMLYITLSQNTNIGMSYCTIYNSSNEVLNVGNFDFYHTPSLPTTRIKIILHSDFTITKGGDAD